MKKIVFTLAALMFLNLGTYAFNYDSTGPSNEFRGTPLVNPVPTANGSAQAYQNMVNASYYRGMNTININHRYYDNGSKQTSPRKTRQHGSAANKRKH